MIDHMPMHAKHTPAQKNFSNAVIPALLFASLVLSSCVSSPPLRPVCRDRIRSTTKELGRFDNSPDQSAAVGSQYREDQIHSRDVAEARRADKLQIEKRTSSNFWIAHVEFDDFGTLAQPRQLVEIEKEVLGMGNKGIFRNGITVVAFVHGWHNNSTRDNENLMNFRKVISGLASREAASGRGVLGVFLSWRGELTKIPVLTQLTYWSRKATAHIIGDGNLSEALVRLKSLNLALADRYPSGFEDYFENTRLVLVGHSFGAAALYSAVADPLKTEYLQAYYRSKSRVGKERRQMELVKGFGDLVLLINPAFEALRYRMIDFHIRDNATVDYDGAQPVIMLIVGSEGDGANRTYFPIGQTLGNAGRLLLGKRTSESGVSGNKKQGRQLITSVGTYEEFATHRLQHGSDGRGTLLNVIQRESERKSIKKFLAKAPNPTPSGQPLTPFMVVQTASDLIPDHNDIWRSDFGKFVVDFVAAQSIHVARSKDTEMRQLQAR